jgi:hypothetical protein
MLIPLNEHLAKQVASALAAHGLQALNLGPLVRER